MVFQVVRDGHPNTTCLPALVFQASLQYHPVGHSVSVSHSHYAPTTTDPSAVSDVGMRHQHPISRCCQSSWHCAPSPRSECSSILIVTWPQPPPPGTLTASPRGFQ